MTLRHFAHAIVMICHFFGNKFVFSFCGSLIATSIRYHKIYIANWRYQTFCLILFFHSRFRYISANGSLNIMSIRNSLQLRWLGIACLPEMCRAISDLELRIGFASDCVYWDKESQPAWDRQKNLLSRNHCWLKTV